MKKSVIIMKTLRLEGETAQQFAVELKKLTPADRDELATLGAKQLNVEVED